MSNRTIDTEEGTILTMTARTELAKVSGSLYTKEGWTTEEFALAARFVRYVEDAGPNTGYSAPRVEVAIDRLISEGVPAKQIAALAEGYQSFAADRTLRAAGVR